MGRSKYLQPGRIEGISLLLNMKPWLRFAAPVVLAACCLCGQPESQAGSYRSVVARNIRTATVKSAFPTRQRLLRVRGTPLPRANQSSAPAITPLTAASATNDFTAADAMTNLAVRPRYIPPPPPKVDPEKLKAEKERLAQNTLAWQKERAEAGSSAAQFAMGMRYLKGDGVEPDPDKAMEYLKKASTNGESRATKKLQELESPPKEEAPARKHP